VCIWLPWDESGGARIVRAAAWFPLHTGWHVPPEGGSRGVWLFGGQASASEEKGAAKITASRFGGDPIIALSTWKIGEQ
jgi:hypothetical protein